MSARYTSIDETAAHNALDAATAAGLHLGATWSEEFVRVNVGPCGWPLNASAPTPPISSHVMLEVDHGSDVTVGVIGDSITSQIRDELVADTRYNWVVASMCASRLDHYLGKLLLPTIEDLSYATDAVLGSVPQSS